MAYHHRRGAILPCTTVLDILLLTIIKRTILCTTLPMVAHHPGLQSIRSRKAFSASDPLSRTHMVVRQFPEKACQ
jgi:hypothetical protein